MTKIDLELQEWFKVFYLVAGGLLLGLVVLLFLYSGAKNELKELEMTSKDFETKGYTYYEDKTKAEEQVKKLTEENTSLKARVDELENFVPKKVGDKVKNLIETDCLFETDVCYRKYIVDMPFNTNAEETCKSEGLDLVSLEMLYKDYDSYAKFLKNFNKTYSPSDTASGVMSVVVTSTIQIQQDVKNGYIRGALMKNGDLADGVIIPDTSKIDYRAYLYPFWRENDYNSLVESTQWTKIGDKQDKTGIDILCYKK